MKPIGYAGLLEDKDDECLELRKKLEKAEAKLKTTAKDLERIADDEARGETDEHCNPLVGKLCTLAKELREAKSNDI